MHTAQTGTTFIFARYYTQLTRFVARVSPGPPRNADFIRRRRILLIWYNTISE